MGGNPFNAVFLSTYYSHVVAQHLGKTGKLSQISPKSLAASTLQTTAILISTGELPQLNAFGTVVLLLPYDRTSPFGHLKSLQNSRLNRQE